jgi:hypothetical protein
LQLRDLRGEAGDRGRVSWAPLRAQENLTAHEGESEKNGRRSSPLASNALALFAAARDCRFLSFLPEFGPIEFEFELGTLNCDADCAASPVPFGTTSDEFSISEKYFSCQNYVALAPDGNR